MVASYFSLRRDLSMPPQRSAEYESHYRNRKKPKPSPASLGSLRASTGCYWAPTRARWMPHWILIPERCSPGERPDDAIDLEPSSRVVVAAALPLLGQATGLG